MKHFSGFWRRCAILALFALLALNATESAAEDERWVALVRKYSAPENAAVLNRPLPLEVLARWWDALGDDVLTQLVEQAFKDNKDMKTARAKVMESRASLGIAKSANMPVVDTTDYWYRTRTSENNGTGNGQTVGLYHLGVDASWELDLFGRNADSISAAAATLEADYASLHDAWVSLSAEVALTYISLRTLQSRLDIAEKNLTLQTDTLDLVRSQYAAGLTNALALAQARYSVEETRATIPTLKANIEQTVNALAILVGEVPGSLLLARERKPLPKPDASVLIGIPAEAVRQRPDIRAAERRLAAQTATRKSAEKDLLPSFSLIGSIGLESLSSGNLLFGDSLGFNIGPRITLPIFHGGAIRKNIKVQSAKEEQLLAAYEKTVLNAVAEVRNALTSNLRERERNASLARGVEAASEACESAEDLYINGLADFSNVIITQQALLSLEDDYASSEGAMVSNIVNLFKALGGGWEPLAPSLSAQQKE
ncbi:MAG: TolC family protein [Synergistaceae bacterium]|nr:TolC family protein [Synergistaceae bacterium]